MAINRIKRKETVSACLLGIYLAVLLWITLFSRIGDDYRMVYQPFWTIPEIINGNSRIILEIACNIVLFIPFGLLCCGLFGLRKRYVVAISLSISLLIECCQWFFYLGALEVDDLLYNTIGTVIGAAIPIAIRCEFRKNIITIAVIICIVFLSLPLIQMLVHCQHMDALAANGNKDDGTENLLVLDGKSGYVSDTQVYVKYLPDGSIMISGESESRAWKRIGHLTLPAGTYSFSGLSGTNPNTFAIELEYYDDELQNFIRLTPDIGPIKEAIFELRRETRIRAYVGVYPDAKGEYFAFPVIYQED